MPIIRMPIPAPTAKAEERDRGQSHFPHGALLKNDPGQEGGADEGRFLGEDGPPLDLFRGEQGDEGQGKQNRSRDGQSKGEEQFAEQFQPFHGETSLIFTEE